MTSDGAAEVIVVGAGVAGLTCAGMLRERGVDAVVLEKSAGVGGRCATRRVNGIPVDHGLSFYHGDHPGFLAALRAVEPNGPFEWPLKVRGTGAPCQPRSLKPGEKRLAFADGASTFPKHLARGIRIELRTRVTAIEATGASARLTVEDGRVFHARTIVLAIPAGQVPPLLEWVRPCPAALRTVIRLVAGISMVRCLTVMAAYPTESPVPDWDVSYPQDSSVLQISSRDSSKRRTPDQQVFVFQARPRWSADHWDADPAAWTATVLAEAAKFHGRWAGLPVWVDTHRWRYARLTGGDSLAVPLLIPLENGSRIGVTGEAMAPDGGVQAAWLAGRAMARRLLGDC